jgi:hypothetical protein
MTIKKIPITEPAVPADEPPPYSDHHTQYPSNQVGSTSTSSTFSSPPPPDAQKAQAPLKVVLSHQPLTGNFLITEVASDKTPPDVFLKTSHSKVAILFIPFETN